MKTSNYYYTLKDNHPVWVLDLEPSLKEPRCEICKHWFSYSEEYDVYSEGGGGGNLGEKRFKYDFLCCSCQEIILVPSPFSDNLIDGEIKECKKCGIFWEFEEVCDHERKYRTTWKNLQDSRGLNHAEEGFYWGTCTRYPQYTEVHHRHFCGEYIEGYSKGFKRHIK